MPLSFIVLYFKAINVGCFLMTRKTRQLYEAALNHLNDICFQQTGRRPTPLLLVSDYEIAILEAMTNCFPTGSARGYWYHSENVSTLSLLLNSALFDSFDLILSLFSRVKRMLLALLFITLHPNQ